MVVIKLRRAGKKKAIAEASAIIMDGGIAAFPTETFYGLGARYDNDAGLQKIYELKQRPKDKAMPVIIGDRKILGLIAAPLESISEKIIERFWPGPLTLLLWAREGLSDFITAGTGRVAVRIPGRSFALDLARSLECPITATSANISGSPPADNAGDVLRYFDDSLDILIDGGITQGRKPSTIVDLTSSGIRILRPGAVPEIEILEAAGISGISSATSKHKKVK